MQIVNNRIVSATEDELFREYLRREMGGFMDFHEYVNRMIECGVEIEKDKPDRIPASQADVDRAKRLAVQEAARYAWAIVFTVLMDKEHATPEILQRVWNEVDGLSEEIANGRVSVADLIDVLKQEYGVELE